MSQSIRRAVAILEHLSEAPRTLTEVSELLDVHKSTALRMLQSLEETRFVRREPGGKYTIGFGLISIGQSALERYDLRAIARPHLVSLSERYGHTVHLAQRSGDQIVYVDKLDGEGAVRMRSRVGRPVELHTAGVAKAILAFLPEDALRAMLAQASFQRFTAMTITTIGEYRDQLELVAARGWAEDDGEYEDYLGCISAPIRNSRGEVFASISLTALRSLADKARLESYLPAVIGTADAISNDLGWVKTA